MCSCLWGWRGVVTSGAFCVMSSSSTSSSAFCSITFNLLLFFSAPPSHFLGEILISRDTRKSRVGEGGSEFRIDDGYFT